MTSATDNLVGTVGGLLAVGIMANVAGKMINNNRPIYKTKKANKKIKKIKFI